MLGGVPSALPAMIKASRIQEKARNVGFDWEKREEVWDKVREELGEPGRKSRMGTMLPVEEEFRRPFLRGDKCRKALRRESLKTRSEHTNRKFISRFNYIRRRAREQGRNISRSLACGDGSPVG